MELDILPELVEGFAANIVAYAALLAAIATVTMALLELVKAALRLRLSYHRRMIRQWIGEGKRYEELLILTVAGVDSAGALLVQPTDRMMGPIQSATNVVMDFPANTRNQRRWFLDLVSEINAKHELVHLDISNEQCLRQIAQRRLQHPERALFDTEIVFHQVTRYFEAPSESEGLNIVKLNVAP